MANAKYKDHARLRRVWRPHVEAGERYCPRCGYWIAPSSEWDLGHNDHDPSAPVVPEHRTCNRGAPSRRRGRLSRLSRAQNASRTW